MIDTLLRFKEKADRSDVMSRLGIEAPFALLTLHRPSNVDDPEALRRIVTALRSISRKLPIVFPIHPRTLKMLDGFGLRAALDGDGSRLKLVEPLSYIDFLHLEARARLVLTDSGGIQEETTILGVPCLTLRENTERPITVTHGTNRLVGSDTGRIVREAERILSSKRRRRPRIPLWDGRAAQRIAHVFRKE
jgi:UDP-N-acetylglucosamine 2-epimerase (non-hydrolysing)